MERNRKCGSGRFALKAWQCSAETFLVMVFLVSGGLGLRRAWNEFMFYFHFQRIFFNKKNEIESLEEDNRWVQDKVREEATGSQEVEEKKL